MKKGWPLGLHRGRSLLYTFHVQKRRISQTRKRWRETVSSLARGFWIELDVKCDFNLEHLWCCDVVSLLFKLLEDDNQRRMEVYPTHWLLKLFWVVGFRDYGYPFTSFPFKSAFVFSLILVQRMFNDDLSSFKKTDFLRFSPLAGGCAPSGVKTSRHKISFFPSATCLINKGPPLTATPLWFWFCFWFVVSLTLITITRTATMWMSSASQHFSGHFLRLLFFTDVHWKF